MVMITEICMNHSLDFLLTKIFQILIHHHPIKECAYSCPNNRFSLVSSESRFYWSDYLFDRFYWTTNHKR